MLMVTMRHHAYRFHQAFSLLELVIVLLFFTAIVALYMAWWLQAEMRVRAVHCKNSLHQIGIAIMIYAADWDGQLMPDGIVKHSEEFRDWQRWCAAIQPYIENVNVLKCINARDVKTRITSYAYIAGLEVMESPHSVVMHDLKPWHSGYANVLTLNGAVKLRSRQWCHTHRLQFGKYVYRISD